MRLTKTINLTHGLLLTGLFLAFSLIFCSHATHAATIAVAAGTDETTANSYCSLSEAIVNINNGDAGTYPECANTSTDVFGINDTITIPEGTITLSANLPGITKPITIRGAGMGKTIIDGAGSWSTINSDSQDLIASGFTVKSALDFGIFAGGNAELTNIEINGANWGITDPSGLVAGIITTNKKSSATTSNITNVYVHNFNLDVRQIIALAVSGGNTDDVSATVKNVTISEITNTGSVSAVFVAAGVFDGGASTGAITAELSNVTVTNISSVSDAVLGFMLASSTQDTQTTSATLSNSTFKNLNGGGDSQFLADIGNGTVIGSAGSAVNSVVNNLTLKNLLMTDNNISDCGSANINLIYGASGTVTNNVSSAGGNLSDSNTCPSFTKSTDKNNITNLKDFLGPLSNNGGYVPTMPLLAGSPAIDSGVTVSGLTSDARGVNRPQGAAYDSGAYEYVPVATLAGTGQNQLAYIVLSASITLFGIFIMQKNLVRAPQK